MMLRNFLPVGQGAFYLERFEFDKERINIIYDCGSLTDVSIVEKEIRSNFEKGEDIEIVFISHVDQDHINGLEYLLKYCNVKNIVLPYMSKIDKWLVSIDYLCKKKKHSVNDFVYKFINNPRIALNSLDSDAGLYGVTEGNGIDQNDWDDVIRLISSGENVVNSISNCELTQIINWEYVPFNFRNTDRREEFKANLKKYDVPFKNIEPSNLPSEWESYKNEIIKAYKDTTGSLNTNSMVLFSGIRDKQIFQYKSNKYNCLFPICCNSPKKTNGCLYTGDYEANSKTKWDELKTAYQDYWDCVGCVQIPHHGSYGNYNKEFALLNAFFVISAGTTNRYKHPSSTVIKDLIMNNKNIHVVTEQDYSKMQLTVLI